MTGACTEDLDTGFVALGYGKVAILGVVQGLSDLMPISSTAHMRVVPALFGWTDPGSAFSAAMQLATVAAVVAYSDSNCGDLRRQHRRAAIARPCKPFVAYRLMLGGLLLVGDVTCVLH